MLFNSLEYVLFLLTALFVYAITPVKYNTIRVLLLLIFSYIFYAWWSWEYLILLFISSFLAYILALAIHYSKNNLRKKLFFILSVITNLGLLFFFKYYNFFIESITAVFNIIGIQNHAYLLTVILPLGISFHTFQTISYLADVFNKKIEPTKNVITFLAFDSFFPQLIAGPIERASSLLVQLEKLPRINIENIKSGVSQILWGLFKKIAVADTAGIIVDYYFNNYQNSSGGSLIIATIFFTFQLYGDFSGYSDIAIGSAKLFGINLIQNFKYPFFSTSITEFWRRWHVSLYNWFRDYVYIPLGGTSLSISKTMMNVFIVFILSGIWHGANLTFVVWGVLNALLVVVEMLYKHFFSVTKRDRSISTANFINCLKMLQVFLLFSLTLVFFRSTSLEQAVCIYQKIIAVNNVMVFQNTFQHIYKISGLAIVIMLCYEWFFKQKSFAFDLSNMPRWFSLLSHLTILIILLAIIMSNIVSSKSFIYFQF